MGNEQETETTLTFARALSREQQSRQYFFCLMFLFIYFCSTIKQCLTYPLGHLTWN